MPRVSVKLSTKSRRARSKRSKRATTLAAPRVRQAVQGMINRTLARNAENKTVGWYVEANTIHNGPITDPDCRPILGSIVQGTDSNERIGDRVKPKSLSVRGIIGLNPDYNPNNKPMLVSVFVLSCKDKRTNALIDGSGGAQAGMADLLKPNLYGTEEVSYDGSTARALFPVNRERFRVHYHRTFKLCPGSLSGGTREFDFVRWSYRFKKMPATLTWDEQTGDDCNNFAPFLAIGFSYTDGTLPLSTDVRLVSEAFSTLTYEDA